MTRLVSTYRYGGGQIDLTFDLNGRAARLVLVTVSPPAAASLGAGWMRSAPWGDAIARGFAEVARHRPKRKPLLASAAEREPGIGRPPKYAAAHYAEVAETYRAHVDAGDPAPVQRIADTFEVPVSTATGWVHEARERGLIEAW